MGCVIIIKYEIIQPVECGDKMDHYEEIGQEEPRQGDGLDIVTN
jgi:hypothetical protein